MPDISAAGIAARLYKEWDCDIRISKKRELLLLVTLKAWKPSG